MKTWPIYYRKGSPRTPSFIVVALALGSLVFADLARAQPRKQCGAFVSARALLTVTPDTGQIAPDVLVAEGRQVVLHGVADRIHGKIDCSISTEPINFRWSLTYHPHGGLPVNVTGQLVPQNALTTRFVAQAGTYVARLETVGLPFEHGEATVRIEAVRHDGWVSIGPDGRNTYNTDGTLAAGAGRINALAIHPNSPNIMYAASARGGVWRSDNAGNDWWPMTDHKGLPAGLSIGRLAVGPSGRAYLSAPDVEGGVAYFGTGGWMYWSDDEGVTWKQVVTDSSCAMLGVGTWHIFIETIVHQFLARNSGESCRTGGEKSWPMLREAGGSVFSAL